MSSGPLAARSLRWVIPSAQAFSDEYTRNLVKGGAFVPTHEEFELREVARVEVELSFLGETLSLDAEIVHCLTPELAPAGTEPGVAVQFLDPAPELRERLAPYLERARAEAEVGAARTAAEVEDLTAGEPADGLEEASFDLEREVGDPAQVGAPVESPERGKEGDPNDDTFKNRAPRAPARFPVRVTAPNGQVLEGRARDISKTGVLLSIDGEELPVGRDVRLTLTHPAGGGVLELSGQVARQLHGQGYVAGVAIRMQPTGKQREVLDRFVSEVSELDQTQRQLGIRGPIEELGAASSLQMFAALVPKGTLVVTSGVEEGTICFQDKNLVMARVGGVIGIKALTRILSWREGFFEFRGHVDPVPGPASPERLEMVVLEALRRIDEGERVSGPDLPPETRFEVRKERLASLESPLSQTEQAVLELAAAAFTARRILDVIPESDVSIRAAIHSLIAQGVITPVG